MNNMILDEEYYYRKIGNQNYSRKFLNGRSERSHGIKSYIQEGNHIS